MTLRLEMRNCNHYTLRRLQVVMRLVFVCVCLNYPPSLPSYLSPPPPPPPSSSPFLPLSIPLFLPPSLPPSLPTSLLPSIPQTAPSSRGTIKEISPISTEQAAKRGSGDVFSVKFKTFALRDSCFALASVVLTNPVHL